MGYKFKPNKSVAKRFKVTKTGKLKRHHSFTSHLMSARPANKRRKLRRSAVLFEGHARNMRQLMGISHLNPARVEHERALVAKGGGQEQGGGATATKSATAKSSPAKSRATESPATKAGATQARATRAPAQEANAGKGPSTRNTRSSK